MKKAVEELRKLCKYVYDFSDRQEDVDKMYSASHILDDLDRWADAQLPVEELDEISEGISHHIQRLRSFVESNSVIVEVLNMGRELLGVPGCLSVDAEALEKVEVEIRRLEKKKNVFEKLRTLYAIESMTEIPNA